jgi:tetratricopeptide (TPR) repeat protein
MEFSLIVIVLVVIGVGLRLVFASSDKNDSRQKENPSSSTSTSTDSAVSSPPTGNAAPSRGGASLLNQLSMINSKSFPALSTKQLPQKLEAFFGRKDIIQEVNNKNWGSGGPICLYGKKAAGKTALAVELAHQLAPKYADAQFYIDLKGEGDKPLSVVQAMGYVLRAFNPQEPIPSDPFELSEQYGASFRGKRILIVLENVKKLSQVKQLMPARAGMMITTSEGKIAPPGSFSRQVKPLHPDEAELLLFYFAPSAKQDAGEIAELCGHSPLAISIAGSFLKEYPDYPLANLLNQLREERRLMKPEGDEYLKEEKKEIEIIDRDVQAIFNIVNKELKKETSTVLRKLALFADSFDEKAEENICGDRANEHLKRLVALKLIEYDPLNQRYSFHEVIRLLVSKEIRPSEKILTHRNLALYYYEVLTEANELYGQDEEASESALNMFDLNWFNIQAGHAWSANKSTEDANIAKLCGDYCTQARILMPMRHPPEDCINWNESALAASRESENIESEKNNLLTLGMQLSSLGLFERAAEYLEDAQRLAYQLSHSKDEKDALDLLGQACLEIGNYERASECFEKVLEFVRLEGNKKNEMQALDFLAQAYYKSDSLEQAELNFTKSLEIAQKTDSKPQEAKNFEDLGLVFTKMKKFTTAISQFKQAKTVARQCKDQKREMGILENMANAHIKMGKPKKGIENLEAALTLAKKMRTKRDQGIILKKMGDFYRQLKEFEKAAEFYEKGWPKIRKGTNFKFEYSLLDSLGETYSELDNDEKALICFRHARSIGKKNSDQYLEAKSLWNMSLTYQKFGPPEEAMSFADMASQACPENPTDEAERLEKEIKEWVLKKVEEDIKGSGL